MLLRNAIDWMVRLLNRRNKNSDIRSVIQNSISAKIKTGQNANVKIGSGTAFRVNGTTYDVGDFVPINMRDYLPSQKIELARKLQEIHAVRKAAMLVFSPASVPTQKKYIQLTKDALSEYALVFPDTAQTDIPAIKKRLIVDDGPFTYSAETSRNEILKG